MPLRNTDTGRWEPAVVTDMAPTPRSYVVRRVAGGVPLRRNRVHLRTTREDFPRVSSDGEEEEEEDVGDASVAPPVTVQAPRALSAPVMQPRRSGRERKQTDFYQAGS